MTSSPSAEPTSPARGEGAAASWSAIGSFGGRRDPHQAPAQRRREKPAAARGSGTNTSGLLASKAKLQLPRDCPVVLPLPLALRLLLTSFAEKSVAVLDHDLQNSLGPSAQELFPLWSPFPLASIWVLHWAAFSLVGHTEKTLRRRRQQERRTVFKRHRAAASAASDGCQQDPPSKYPVQVSLPCPWLTECGVRRIHRRPKRGNTRKRPGAGENRKREILLRTGRWRPWLVSKASQPLPACCLRHRGALSSGADA